MKRKQLKPFWKLRHAQKFVELRNWLNGRVTLKARQDPLNSIMSVDNTTLSVANAFHNIRFAFVAPWVLCGWILLLIQISTFGPNEGEVSFANSNINLKKELIVKGINYDESDYIYYEALVGKDGESSILEYIDAVSNYGGESYKDSVYLDIIIICVLLVISMMATVAFLRLPRMADIYFDRQRKIVYTWRFGKIAACNFDNLGARENMHGLALFLYSENKKQESGYWPTYFLIQPTGRAHFNNENDNTEFMAQLFAFMEKGKSAVITEERFERPQPKSYLFIDKKPENFEQRLEEILKRDDELPKLYAEHVF
ncbi:hypothetical protein [Shewanella pealeana]|uniref:Uncharacterized protein n=1 Tax=Shewanella pealeana (strain ATCC 700345 / ANG-SQ1) TaxID=398579 RepID=A8H4P0_SHEPA|nr:hypothetical protein [Shewanella pealeana]ABV87527.1 conserved hypothetical protein [Shewanella pealeana ATCC 700345]